jgi:hypothetical protein
MVPPSSDPKAAALHSRYNPRGEAERYINSLNLGAGIEYFILLEPGLGYLVPALQKKYPEARIISLHVDRAFQKASGELKIPAWFLGDEPGLQQFLENQIPDTEARSIRIIEWRPSIGVYGKKYLWLMSETADFIRRIDANERTARSFGKRWLGNFFRNLGLLRVLVWPGPFEGPLLVTGSGPSLEDSIPLAAELKKRGPLFILAASSSVKALVRGGLAPDMLISADGGAWALIHLYECFRRGKAGNPPLLAANLTAALPSQCSTLPILVLSDGSLWQSLVFRGLGIPALNLPQRGTVSAAALDLALLLSSGNIFITGMDLAVRDIKTHARPYGFDPLFWGQASRFSPFYSRIFSRAREINRGESLKVYAAWFRRQQAAWPNRIFSMGNNNPVFQTLKPWDHPGGGLCTGRAREVAAFPAGRTWETQGCQTLRDAAAWNIDAPAGISAARGAEILAEALSVPSLAESLSGELAPLLFPGQKYVPAGELAEGVRALVPGGGAW